MKQFEKYREGRTYPHKVGKKEIRMTADADGQVLYADIDVFRMIGYCAPCGYADKYNGKERNGMPMVAERRTIRCWCADGRQRQSRCTVINETLVKALLSDLKVDQYLVCLFCDDIFPVGRSYGEFVKMVDYENTHPSEKLFGSKNGNAAGEADVEEITRMVDDLVLACIMLKKALNLRGA